MAKRGAGRLNKLVVFTPPKILSDGYGNEERGWDSAQALTVWAGIIYRSGREVVEEGVRTGQGFYKVKIRQSIAARKITTDWQLKLVNGAVVFDITEIDQISDRAYIWISAITRTGVST